MRISSFRLSNFLYFVKKYNFGIAIICYKINVMELDSLITDNFRVTEPQKTALKKIGLHALRDLLFYFPSRYGNSGEIKMIKDVLTGDLAIVYGKIGNLKTRKAFRRKIPMGEATLEDLSGRIKVIWFNQAYMAKMVHEGQTVKLTGKITEGKSGVYMANPEIENAIDLPVSGSSLFGNKQNPEENFLYPVYPETRGITSKWIYHHIKKIITDDEFKTIDDYLPEEIIKKYNLPTLKTALIWIHSPKNENDAASARKRFSFEEVFFIQLARHRDKIEYQKNDSFKIAVEKKDIDEFVSRFPFEPTKSQRKAIEEISHDLEKPHPMSRLLEGDVGSGKTMVAAAASYAVVKNHPAGQNFGNLQVAYMAPTEILAAQHFESFIRYFAHLNMSVGLITGGTARKFPSKISPHKWTDISRPQLLKWVANGEIPILFGTHTLIQKKVKFKNLALVLVDEQHRFGTNQRAALAKKEGFAPHFLSMTATPIPRTLALTIYGDLDLTLLDEMPHGRKQTITEIISPNARENAYEKIRKEIESGRQVYVICPRINEPDPEKENALNAKSVESESKRLGKEVFPGEAIGILHSKMTKEKKEKVMKDFADGNIQILVSTSVVEVGVNVPNATVIIIEGAERFGLASLHQLRGRVQRSEHQSYCYVFSETKTQKSLDRLKALKTAKNGFELSELDLTLRGAGDMAGLKQWGISDIGMEAIRNIKMVEAARAEAQHILNSKGGIEQYPKLKKIFEHKNLKIHFE